MSPGLTRNVQRPLQEPIVSCDLGKLYNKDAVIEFLLDRSAFGDGEQICGHIRSLKVCSTFVVADCRDQLLP